MGTQLNVSELMEGRVTIGAPDYATGEAQGEAIALDLLVQMADIDMFVTEPRHAARLDGHVAWRGERCELVDGEFNMLIPTTDRRENFMFYRVPFTTSAGKRYTLNGHKRLRDDPGLDVLADITTLFVQLYDGDVPGYDLSKPIGEDPMWPPGHVALGIIRISAKDSLHNTFSFEAPGATTIHEIEAIGKFVKFYGTRVFDLYVLESKPKRWLLFAALAALALGVGLIFLLR
jgi:cholesterol oxidase